MKTLIKILIPVLSIICPMVIVAQSLSPVREGITRQWVGPEYWTNPLMNWRLANGRIENDLTPANWAIENETLAG